MIALEHGRHFVDPIDVVGPTEKWVAGVAIVFRIPMGPKERTGVGAVTPFEGATAAKIEGHRREAGDDPGLQLSEIVLIVHRIAVLTVISAAPVARLPRRPLPPVRARALLTLFHGRRPTATFEGET